MRHATTITIVLVLAVLATTSGASAKHEKSACRATAKLVKKACDNEMKEELSIAHAKCANLADHDAREQCRDEADAARDEAKEDCADQLEGRKEFCEAVGQAPYDPVIVPGDFLSPSATAANPNPFFPLVVGTVRTYEGGGEVVTVTVTDQTKVILGVTTIVVRDVVTKNAVVVEDTEDYFAQHVDGTVWYFGEFVKNFEDGVLVDVDGSFTAGVDGAKPGIIMKAAPMVGDFYRQEFAIGEAEDAAEVISTTGTETAPAASCSGTCVVTRDFNLLEPGVDEHKFYAPDIGLIVEVDLETGERLELVSIED